MSNIYDEVKARAKLISMAEDEAHILSKKKAREQNRVVGKSKPWQLVERINEFKEEKVKHDKSMEYYIRCWIWWKFTS